ncbi:type II toxin-antitoxin system prevent-host-death family antitoxin [Actinoplanes couchii]|uniref:type II toxin-antitoxin system prevent-host-death family antitoxin n=1 Tax=Actinoplanes couchii TaxID=403638 RepID=UPI001941E503|nr:type II toxin-antitoxin system prevent-host-death family antitoxin [Actinoplanes couchii]MDR6324091.1 antitoxin (DNA-binding transcriptional repressor) of toxin-antitoxin stability system [Actinoplanes couchii]
MREPRAGASFASPDDFPLSLVLPELLENVERGQVVYLSKDGVPVAAVVPLEVAEAGLAALRRSGGAE